VEEELFGRLAWWMRETGDPILAGPVPTERWRRQVEAIRNCNA